MAAKKAAKAKLEVEPVEVNVSWDVPRPGIWFALGGKIHSSLKNSNEVNEVSQNSQLKVVWGGSCR